MSSLKFLISEALSPLLPLPKLTFPSMILSRIRPSIFLPTIMFLWGVVTIGMGFVPNYKSLVVFRIVIGCLEAGFAPGVLLLLSSWYKRGEQSKRFSVYISAAILSGAFGGLIAGGIEGGLDGKYGIAGWRWLFIIEGTMTAGWSIIASFILLDFPANSKRLSERERELAIQRILSEGLSVRSEDIPEISHIQALKLALSNWRTWAFTIGYMVRHSLITPSSQTIWLTLQRTGDCGFIHLIILLSNPRQRLGIHFSPSPVHDRSNLWRRLHLHRNNRLLHRQGTQQARSHHRSLACNFSLVLCHHLRSLQLRR